VRQFSTRVADPCPAVLPGPAQRVGRTESWQAPVHGASGEARTTPGRAGAVGPHPRRPL